MPDVPRAGAAAADRADVGTDAPGDVAADVPQLANVAGDETSPCAPPCAPGQLCVGGTCFAPVRAGGDTTDVATDVPRDAPVCAMSTADCNGDPSDGCEADRRNGTIVAGIGVTNCGACGVMCPAAAHAFGICASATCRLLRATGYGDCNGMPGNECETNTYSNSSNCGRCLHVCGGSTPKCTAGTCVP